MHRAIRARWAIVASLLLLSPSIVRAEPAVHVKKAIADTMKPEELAAYTAALAEELAAHPPVVNVPADTCAGATAEVSALPFGPVADTTVGGTDDFDLPSDTSAPTCTAPTSCTGAGPMGSLPRGAVYTGTGTGNDRAYKIRTDAPCDLTITADPTAADDLALIVYEAACSGSLGDCACVDDTGSGGTAEVVTLNAQAGVDYFIVVDGYSAGAAAPGPAGPFTLSITGTGCNLVSDGTTTTSSTTTTTSTSTTTTEPPTTTSSTTTTSTTSTSVAPPASTSTTIAPGGSTTTTSLPPVGPSGCTAGVPMSKASLRITKLDDPSGDEGLKLSGVLVFPPGAPDPFDPSAHGAQILVEDLGAGSMLFDLASTPIPPGARGDGCGPKDGWKGTGYQNASGALDPPACPPGSARGLRSLKLSDKRAKGKGIAFVAKAKDATIPLPQGPVRMTIVTSADASAMAAGHCATHTFGTDACTVGKKGVTCK